jgi:quinol monooxygenase YgiN
VAYCLAVKWTIKDGELDAVLAALRSLTDGSRQEPGCLL